MAAPLEQTSSLGSGPVPATAALSEEIARLELLRRLAMGAAHTLNNAFTAILGETLCLLDERKDDSAVAEACLLIQQEIERCARLTRSVALRVQRRESLLDETDVSALLRGVESLLRETVSRAVAIRCEVPEPGRCVRGSVEDLELLVLLIAHRLARGTASGGALHIASECADRAIELRLELRVDPGAARSRAAPGNAWEEAVDTAVGSIAQRIGARLLDGGAHAVRLELPRSSER